MGNLDRRWETGKFLEVWCGGCNHRHPGNWNRNILGMTEPLKKGGWKTNLSPFGARPIFRGENLWPTAHWIYLQDADGFVRFEIDWCNFPKGFPCCWPHGVIGFCQKNCDHKSDTTHTWFWIVVSLQIEQKTLHKKWFRMSPEKGLYFKGKWIIWTNYQFSEKVLVFRGVVQFGKGSANTKPGKLPKTRKPGRQLRMCLDMGWVEIFWSGKIEGGH